MDELSREILKELLPAEKEAAPRKKARAGKQEAPQADRWPQAVLLERAAYLRQMARFGQGEASETLKEFPQHAAMLSFRARDGEAEQHADCADLFVVLSGQAALVTGGTVSEARTIAPGEVRGRAVEGGVRHELRGGDLIHVPAGVAHQVLVSGEKTFTAFVLKIRETPLPAGS